MPKRRRKSDDSTSMIVVAILLFIGAIIAYRQEQWSLFWSCVVLCLTMLIIISVLALIHLHKNEKIRRAGMDEIDLMSGIEFEKYLQLLLRDKGYTNVRLTQSYDLGIDIIAEKDGDIWGIQAKRYKGSVGLDSVRQVVTALRHYKCTRAMVITNSYFTKNAQTIAGSIDCLLIDRAALINMILEKQRREIVQK
jgi:restriction system protein